jgi:hypothetical protein
MRWGKEDKSKLPFAEVGDCVEARKIGDAIFEGAFAALSLDQSPEGNSLWRE